MSHYVGLDISMKETVICIVNDKGVSVHRGKTKTDPEKIAYHLKKIGLKIEKIGLESGSLSHWLVNELRKLELPAICIDARKMAVFLSVRVNKTDDNDAQGIAEAMRCGLYKEVCQKSQQAVETSTLMQCRRTLVQQRVQLINSIRGFLKTYGVRLGSCGEKEFSEKVRAILPGALMIAREGVESLVNCYEKLSAEIKILDKRVETLAKEDEDVKRLMTVPGVGIVTAMTFKIEIDDPHRFKNSRDVGAYFGMTPRQYSSGETKRQGRISKCGSSEMRSLLMEAGLVCLTRSKKWSRVKAWGLKIMRKNGAKKASVAVGRKLAVIMHRMLLEKKDFIHGEEKKVQVKAA
ncbi:MAG: IS110 family transposase [Simkaniaceae bacterium]|nr:IS110 family transposase [Simkaniaceae bacterium]